MRTMKTCSRSPLLLLWFIHVTIPAVLEAQEVKVSSTVTGYLGHDVTLPCTFIQGAQHADITQVQWELKPPEGENIVLIVFNVNFGVSVYNTFLKDRVELEEQSLIVRDVQMTDAGSYTCSIATFPSGSFEGTTNLVVQDVRFWSNTVSVMMKVVQWCVNETRILVHSSSDKHTVCTNEDVTHFEVMVGNLNKRD
ncbi:nectin-1-like isoform X3 [Epinephelus fuscoguttatus]|uniref:nectin-1-like isoform X3 n=1 Tax=Epinephelus fuscoguttatus TaxID=293821 RepID=UPI0020D04A5A|nr:nectin-1-like isoform X3 [Epinephelus fuscoguttatus]